MKKTINRMPPILYWYAKVDESGEVIYHLILNEDEQDLSCSDAEMAMNSARNLNYPIICLN